MKALHPDVNPNLGEGQRRLWLRVQEAYERADLEALRALTLLAGKGGDQATALGDTIEGFRHRRDALDKHVAEHERRIAALEAQPPISLRESLADDAWIEARRAEIEARTAGFTAKQAASDAVLEAIENSLSHGPKPGRN